MLNDKVKILIQDNQNNIIYNITEAVGDFSITQQRKGQATKFTGTIYNIEKKYIPKGSKMMLYVNDKEFFYGYYAENEIDKWNTEEITFYDQLQYLAKSTATYNFGTKTATQILRTIANDFNLVVGQCDETNFKVGMQGLNPHANETLFDMILSGLDHTLINTGRLYTLRDDFGKLRIQLYENITATNELKVGYNIFDFHYKGTINEETYNRVKLVYQADSEAGIDTTAQFANDSVNEAKWGTFQYYDTINDMSLVVGQASNLAQQILALHNREYKNLQVSAVGDIECIAGGRVWIDIGKVDNTTINSYQLINKITHNFCKGIHTMDLDVIDMKGV